MRDILLTGAAGGLGAAVAAYLAEHGCRVFACDARMPQTAHPNIIPHKMDVRSSKSINDVFTAVSAQTQGLDALINMAGIYLMDSFIEISEERLQSILDINLMGVYRVNKTFLPLVQMRCGRIIITTSELDGQKPLPFNGVYALSKTALGCYADALRHELQFLGIPVIVIRPGAFCTRLLDTSHHEMARMCAESRLYQTNADKLRTIMNSRMQNAKRPEILAKVFHRAVTARKPRLIYTKNASIGLKLYSLLPRRLGALAVRLLLK